MQACMFSDGFKGFICFASIMLVEKEKLNQ